jgi:hypothetical protein
MSEAVIQQIITLVASGGSAGVAIFITHLVLGFISKIGTVCIVFYGIYKIVQMIASAVINESRAVATCEQIAEKVTTNGALSSAGWRKVSAWVTQKLEDCN